MTLTFKSMRISKTVIFLSFLLSGSLFNIAAQNKSDTISKFEIGIDFVRYNRNWIYQMKQYNSFLYPINSKDYIFDFIPSIFAKYSLGTCNLRFKYEYFKSNYSFTDHIADGGQYVFGNYKNNRILLGLEKHLIDSKFKVYYSLDFGISIFNFSGINAHSSGFGGSSGINYPFNINGLGLSMQPGLGIKYQIFKNLYINLESSIYFEKGLKRNDTFNLYSKNKFIPRPISLFGFSYAVHKKLSE
jgi:hypothetical protein